MLLVLDAGNTQTHAGVFLADELRAEWRMSTDRNRTADEMALALQAFFSLKDLSFPDDVSGAAIASVVPPLTAALREMAERYLGVDPVVLGPGTKTGMPVMTQNPKEVGADRIANGVAAHALASGPVIVVDFGTATTFDAISARGEYLGGAIAAGIEVSVNALSSAAAQISRTELLEPRTAIGTTTAESIRSGILFGAAAMVEGMIPRIEEELGGRATVVATGGLAPLVMGCCDVEMRHEPALTLNGLRLIHQRNAA